MLISGRVLDVFLDNVGTAVYEDAAAAATTLKVVSAGTFDDDGGQVVILGDVYDYSNIVEFEDYDTIDLSPGLLGAVTESEEVNIYPVITQKKAIVSQSDGEVDDSGVVENNDILATIGLGLASQFAVGPRDDVLGEYVYVDDESGDWVIQSVIGQTPVVRGEDISSPIPTEYTSDGLSPEDSPVPTLEQFGIGGLRWAVDPTAGTPNADPVKYRIYADVVSPVTIDAAHQVADTAATSASFSTIGGVTLLPDDPLTTIPSYYVASVRYDRDGEGPVSATIAVPVAPKRADNKEVSADYIYGNKIQANQIEAGTFTADLAMVGQLSVGNYVVLDGDESSISIYADEEHMVELVRLKPDGSVFRGTVIADDVSVLNGIVLRGEDSRIEPDSGMTLEGSISDPITGATVGSSAALLKWPAIPTGYVCRGLAWDTTDTVWIRLLNTTPFTAGGSLIETISPSGVHIDYRPINVPGIKEDYINGIVRSGSFYYLMYQDTTGGSTGWFLARWSAVSTPVFSNSVYVTPVTSTRPSVGTDSSPSRIIVAITDQNEIRTYNGSMVLQGVWTGTIVNGHSTFVGGSNFDFGTDKICIAVSNIMYVFTRSGSTFTEDTSKRFTLVGDASVGGVDWRNSVGFFSTHGAASLYGYNSYYPAASERAYVAFRDTDNSSKKHTKRSPITSYAIAARRYVSVSLPGAPSGASTPHVFMALGTSTPADSALLKRPESLTSRSGLLDPGVAGGYALLRTLNVTTKQIASNIATLTTSANHDLQVGDQVDVAGVDATFNGNDYIVTAVPSLTTFSYAKTASNTGPSAATGTVSVDDINTFGAGNPGWIKTQFGGFELYGDGSGAWPAITDAITSIFRTGRATLTVAAANTDYQLVVTFVTPFPVGHTPRVVLVAESTTANGRQIGIDSGSVSRTGFTINYRNSASSSFNAQWIAINDSLIGS